MGKRVGQSVRTAPGKRPYFFFAAFFFAAFFAFFAIFLLKGW